MPSSSALLAEAGRDHLKQIGELPGLVKDAAMAKLYSSQVAQKVSGQAVEWMGGMGFVREGLAEKYWRDSKIGAIYEASTSARVARQYEDHIRRKLTDILGHK